MLQRSTPPDASTVQEFERVASTTRDVVATRGLVAAVMRQAMEARPPQSVTDLQDAHVKIADYAAYCTFAGIASLQTRTTR